MASRIVEQLLDAFRNHFAEETLPEAPLALRQESSDVVFIAMLEDDAPAKAPPSPLIQDLMSDPVGDPFGEVGEALGPAMAEQLSGMGLPGFGGMGDLEAGQPDFGDEAGQVDAAAILGGLGG